MAKSCRYCGGEVYVEAPPFEQMSNKDIEDWKNSGGRVMELCKDCGREDLSEEQIRIDERQRVIDDTKKALEDYIKELNISVYANVIEILEKLKELRK